MVRFLLDVSPMKQPLLENVRHAVRQVRTLTRGLAGEVRGSLFDRLARFLRRFATDEVSFGSVSSTDGLRGLSRYAESFRGGGGVRRPRGERPKFSSRLDGVRGAT